MRESIIWITFICLFLGCSSGEYQESSPAISNRTDTIQESASSKGSSGKADELASANAFRQVIYDATIEMIVDDFYRFSRELPQIVIQSGGYIADVSLKQHQDFDTRLSYRSGTWKVKVGSKRFDAFLLKLTDLGFIVSHDQTAQDVTADYVDLQARITNKMNMESRVLELIKDAKRDLREIMSLEKELGRIRGDIERMQGQLNVIKNRTELATLTISSTEKIPAVVAVMPEFRERIANAWNASIGTLRDVVQFTTVLTIVVLPWIIVLLIGAFLLLSLRIVARRFISALPNMRRI